MKNLESYKKLILLITQEQIEKLFMIILKIILKKLMQKNYVISLLVIFLRNQAVGKMLDHVKNYLIFVKKKYSAKKKDYFNN